MRQLQVFSLFLLLSPAIALAQGSELARLARLTIESSPQIEKSENSLKITELEHRNSFWRLFPVLDLQSRYGLAGDDPATSQPGQASDLSLRLSHALYDPESLATMGRYKYTSTRVQRARLEFNEERDLQLLTMVHAYLDWSAAMEQKTITDSKSDLLNRQFNLLNSQYKQGLKTKRDVLRIETELKRLRIELLQQKNEVDLSLQKLAAAVGVERDRLLKMNLQGERAKPVKSQPPLAELNRAQHRLWRILKLREEESRYETGFAERRYFPTVSLESEIQYRNQDIIGTGTAWSENEAWNWQSLLVLRYSLWDWGIERRHLQMARLREQNVKSDSERELLNLSVELREVDIKLRQFHEHISASRDLLQLEEQSYSVLATEYRSGRATYLDLITNLDSLIDARSKFVDSYYDYNRQQYVHSFHKGSLYEDVHEL